MEEVVYSNFETEQKNYMRPMRPSLRRSSAQAVLARLGKESSRF